MKTALLVVDAQNIYTDPKSEMHCRDAKGTLKRINQLIERYSKANLQIVLVRHVHKADATDLGRMFDYAGDWDGEFNFREGTPEVDYDPKLIRPKAAVELVKNRYSAFAGTDLDRRLRDSKVEGVAICGFMTNFCCESTARGAHDRDYFVDFVLDATGTPGTDFNEKKVREVVGELLSAGFCNVMSTRSHLGSRWPQPR